MHSTFKYIPIVALALSSASMNKLYAQQRSVQGKVTDANTGQVLPGVSVRVSDQNKSTLTNANGEFTINITGKDDPFLEFSFIGYESQQLRATGSTISLALKPSSTDLEEVVVVAYGTSKRSNITGSVSTVSSKAIENRQVSNITKALEGQVPGLQSVASSGQPGTGASIRIRGIGSINASSAPLFVVDGSPYMGDINSLNPNDIQSISVLKDAASSALYGSRGANGVIIITTKSGTASSDTKINLNFTQGYSTRAVRDYDQVTTDEYFQLYWEAVRNKELSNGRTAEQAAKNASAFVLEDLNINPYGSQFPQPVGLDGKLVAGAKTLWDDPWTDVLQRTGVRTQADLGFSGGGAKSTYYISGGYLNDQGIAIESGFKRYNLRANLDSKVKSWLNVGVNIGGSSTLQKYPQSEDSNTANIINFTRLVPSFYPYYERNPDGSFVLDANGNKVYDFGEYRPSGATPRNNLAASLPLDKNDIRRDNLSARAYLEALLTSNLKLKSTYSVDYINGNTHDYTNPLLGDGVNTGGSVSRSNVRTVSQTWNNLLTYEKQFGLNYINVLGGQEYYAFNSSNISGSRNRFVLPGFYEPAAASQLNDFTGYSDEYRLLSFLGRAEYNYNSKYYLSASLRTDGSARFSKNTRWGTFWSVGGSWKIAQEDFLKDKTILDQLTLRASYGGQGNDNLSTYYEYQELYAIANNNGKGGTYTSRLGTPGLQWESNLNMNIGLDVSAFNNRVALNVEYYIRKSKDLLFTMPMAPSTGYSGFSANAGAMQNTGIDVDIHTIPVRNDNFRWNLDVNFSHFKNKITSLPNNNKSISTGNKLMRVGGSLYDFYIPEWAGVNQKTGLPEWYVADANGQRTENKTSEYGKAGNVIGSSSLPDLTGGIQNSFNYRNFDLSAFVSFSLGGKVLDSDYVQVMHNGSNPGRAWSKEILERWTPENTQTDVPKLTTDNLSWTSASTRFLYSGTYARLKNVSLGYSLPAVLTKRIGIEKLRVFVTGENLLTFYGHQGMDPEQTVNGATYFRYPAMRTVSGGLQLAF